MTTTINVHDQLAEVAALAEFVEAASLSFATTAREVPLSDGAWLGFWLVAHDLRVRIVSVSAAAS